MPEVQGTTNVAKLTVDGKQMSFRLSREPRASVRWTSQRSAETWM